MTPRARPWLRTYVWGRTAADPRGLLCTRRAFYTALVGARALVGVRALVAALRMRLRCEVVYVPFAPWLRCVFCTHSESRYIHTLTIDQDRDIRDMPWQADVDRSVYA